MQQCAYGPLYEPTVAVGLYSGLWADYYSTGGIAMTVKCKVPFPVLLTIRQLLAVEFPTASVESLEAVGDCTNRWEVKFIDRLTGEVIEYLIDGDDGDFIEIEV